MKEYAEKNGVLAFYLTSFVKSIAEGDNVDEDKIDKWVNYCDVNNLNLEGYLIDKQIVGRAVVFKL